MKDENPFKQKLYHHTLQVPEGLWDRIETQLPRHSDHKKFPLFYFIAAALIIIGLAALFLLLNSEKQEKIQDEAPSKEIITPLSSELHPFSSNTTSVAQKTPAEDHNSPAVDKEQSIASTSFDGTKNNPNNFPGDGVKSDQKTISTASLKGSNNGSSHITDQNTSAIQNEIKPEVRGSNSNRIPTDEQLAVSSERSFLATDFLESELQLIASDEDLTEISGIYPDPSCYKFTGEEKRSNLSVDIFGGPGFSPRMLESSTPESVVYVQARKATESFEYAWSAGARINYNLNQEFAVRLGITFEQTGDVFDYTDTSATIHSTRIDSFFSADGTFLYEETHTVLILGTLIKRIHNRYNHLDLPLLASYELPLGRSRIMVNAGPVINLTTSSRGQILDASLNPKHITIGQPNRLNAYKTNVGLSLYLGAGLSIPVSKTIYGIIEPKYVYRLKPVTVLQYPLKEHRHFGGLNLGIRYYLE